jgi:pyrrolidone-carboxylate peptidase
MFRQIILRRLAVVAQAARVLVSSRSIESQCGLDYAHRHSPAWFGDKEVADILDDTESRNVMLTGYWPPTNHMLRPFSTNPTLNPDGWIGENWEGLGYDIHAFFPEFNSFPEERIGTGDLQVDYQSTSKDFWRIANIVRPRAIITFSRGKQDAWVIERIQRNLSKWRDDFRAPHQPTPSPPDNSLPADAVRPSTLPIDSIEAAINRAGIAGVSAETSADGGGSFLSEFIAYHGVWYQAKHSSPSSPRRCVAAGHIHVGQFSTADARHATMISIRTVIAHVREIMWPIQPGEKAQTTDYISS